MSHASSFISLPLLGSALLPLLASCSVLFDAAPENSSDAGIDTTIDATPQDAGARDFGSVLPLSEVGRDSIAPDITSALIGFRVAWEEETAASSRRLAATTIAEGAVEPGEIILATVINARAAIESNRSNVAVAWLEGAFPTTVLKLGRYDDNFAMTTLPLTIADDGQGATDPSLARAPDSFGVAWTSAPVTDSNILFKRVLDEGSLDAEVILVGEAGQTPSIANVTGNFVVAWRGLKNDDKVDVSEIFVRRIPETVDMIESAHSISLPSAQALTPKIVAADSRFAVVWREIRGNQHSILFRSFADPSDSGERITLSTPGNEASAPAVAFSGLTYGVAWQERRNGQMVILFTELSEQDEVLYPPVQLSEGIDGASQVELSFAEDQFAAVWQQGANGAHRIYFRSFAASGLPSQP